MINTTYHHRHHPALKLFVAGLAVHVLARHHGHGPFGSHREGRGSRGFGPPHGGRRFGRGDLKYVILDLLQDGPRHGYDIIRALEERFHGFYTPSAGSVYPTLQLLEDQDMVTSDQYDGKRVYTISDAGRTFLKEHAGTVEDVHSRAGFPRTSPELRSLMDEARHAGETLFRHARGGGLEDPEKLRRLREVLASTRQEIEAILHDDTESSDRMV